MSRKLVHWYIMIIITVMVMCYVLSLPWQGYVLWYCITSGVLTMYYVVSKSMHYVLPTDGWIMDDNTITYIMPMYTSEYTGTLTDEHINIITQYLSH